MKIVEENKKQIEKDLELKNQILIFKHRSQQLKLNKEEDRRNREKKLYENKIIKQLSQNKNDDWQMKLSQGTIDEVQLMQMLNNTTFLNEREKKACEIILQVMGAIEYCHNKGVAHRDLKPENLLYLKEGSEENNPLKIIDFGLSRDINLKKLLSSKVGTAYYVSPEILAGQYNEKCDVWSAGVILYVLLSGEPPFNGPSDGVIYSKIKQLKFNFPEKKWKNISNEAKDLLSKMLLPEKDRLSASQVLLHPWFNLVNDNKIPLEKINFGLTNFFKEYKESNKLKKIVLLYIASKLQEDEILDLNNLFKAFDKDNNGQIDYKEFEQGIMKLIL